MRQLAGGDRAVVFQAAEDALVEAGFQIDRRDEAAGLLTTFPIAATSADIAGHRSRRLGTPAALRRVADVRLEEAAGGVTAYCRVLVQEQTTEAYRLREYDLRGSDTPGYTAIDREAATTKAQNTVWRTIRRDKGAERAILAGIQERTGAQPSSAGAADKP
jgi:hypothetical protein